MVCLVRTLSASIPPPPLPPPTPPPPPLQTVVIIRPEKLPKSSRVESITMKMNPQLEKTVTRKSDKKKYLDISNLWSLYAFPIQQCLHIQKQKRINASGKKFHTSKQRFYKSYITLKKKDRYHYLYEEEKEMCKYFKDEKGEKNNVDKHKCRQFACAAAHL